MKIAILSFYSGHIERGVENWASQLKNNLPSDYTVTIFQNGPTASESDDVSLNIPVNFEKPDPRGNVSRMLFCDYWSKKIFAFSWKLLPLLLDYDVIIPTNGGWQSLLIRIYTWLKGKRMVVVGHAGKGWDDRVNLWTCPDVFVGLSSYAKSWAQRVNPFVKSVYIPNGVDIKKFSFQKKQVAMAAKLPLVLSVAALEKNKRLDLTIRAVAKTNLSLQILGEGPDKEQLQELGQKLLGKRFALTSVSFSAISDYYHRAKVFTLGSWSNEAFAMVILEAMAANIPVVATRDPIRQEIVGSAGILVDPQDTFAYAQALVEAAARNWGDIPREQAKRYAWNTIANQYAQLFHTLERK